VKVACVGGGPGGLYLSILLKLRDRANEVTVYERSRGGSRSGWGVTFGRELLRDLREQDQESADAIRSASFTWRDQVVHVRGEQVVAPGDDAYNISRQLLIDILTERALALGVRIEYDIEIASPVELPDVDLIVAADGVNSKLRAASGGFSTNTTFGANKYIWLGSSKVFDSFNFIFSETDYGWIWAHAYGIDAETSTFIVECSEATWAGLGFDTMSTGEALPILESVFKEHLDGCRLMGELGDGSTARWLNFKIVSNEHWNSGNIVLLGDSAHTAHFAIGMGTTLAIRDAICLADCLRPAGPLESALESYQRQRKRELIPTLAEADCSTRWLENIARYIDLRPREFGVLLYARRSPLTAVLPTRISYLLRSAAEQTAVLDAVRAFIAPTAKLIYNRRQARPTREGAR
jgi:2-polyprenyl-6-methoxyphenol hydroxylase-like FAD-dependent oxidoreductase